MGFSHSAAGRNPWISSDSLMAQVFWIVLIRAWEPRAGKRAACPARSDRYREERAGTGQEQWWHQDTRGGRRARLRWAPATSGSALRGIRSASDSRPADTDLLSYVRVEAEKLWDVVFLPSPQPGLPCNQQSETPGLELARTGEVMSCHPHTCDATHSGQKEGHPDRGTRRTWGWLGAASRGWGLGTSLGVPGLICWPALFLNIG